MENHIYYAWILCNKLMLQDYFVLLYPYKSYCQIKDSTYILFFYSLLLLKYLYSDIYYEKNTTSIHIYGLFTSGENNVLTGNIDIRIVKILIVNHCKYKWSSFFCLNSLKMLAKYLKSDNILFIVDIL